MNLKKSFETHSSSDYRLTIEWTSDHWPMIDHWSANNCPIADQLIQHQPSRLSMNYEIHSIHRLAENSQKLRNAILQILPLETSSFHIFREKKKMMKKRTKARQLLLIKTPQSSPLIFTFFSFFQNYVLKNDLIVRLYSKQTRNRRGCFIEVISNDFETNV